MACSHEAPNGKESILYQKLQQLFGADRAHNYWTAVRSQQFLNDFGWLNASGEVPMDANGEPSVEWVLDKLEIPMPTQQEEKESVEVNFEPDKPVSVIDRAEESFYLEKINSLYSEATANPDKIYKVTYKYEGEKRRYASGYTAKEMANLFDAYPIPTNVIFDIGFDRLVKNSTARIRKEFESSGPIPMMPRDTEKLNDDLLMILIAKKDDNGNTVGFFSPQEQQDIVDSIKFLVHQQLIKDANLGANALIKTFYLFQQKAYQLLSSDPDSVQGKNFSFVVNQRVRFAEEAMRGMENLGLHTNPKVKAQILIGIEAIKPLSEQEKKLIEETPVVVSMEEVDAYTGELIEVSARGLRDWSDSSFELDPKDTASARMKMFIATLPDMDRAIYTSGQSGVVIDPMTIKIGDYTLDELIKSEGVEDALELWKEGNLASLQNVLTQSNRKSIWLLDEKKTDKLIEFANENFPLIPKTNFLGLRKLVDFESTFQEVLELLADLPQDIETYLDALATSNKPNLEFLGRELLKTDQSFRNGFAKVVSKQYQEFVMVLFNRTTTNGKTNYTLNPINANRYNQKATIIKNWQANQKISELMILNETGNRVLDVSRIRNRWLPFLKEAQEVTSWEDQDTVEWAKDFMQQVFGLSGIEMTDDMMDYLFDNIEELTKQKMAGGLRTQFSVSRDGKPTGIFSAFILKAAGMTEQADGIEPESEEALVRAEIHNPLYTEGYTMRILSTVAAKFTPVLHSATHKSSEGKNIWDYGLNTKLSHKFRTFLKDFPNEFNRYSQIYIAKDNLLLNQIQDQPARLNSMKLVYLDGLKPTWGKKGTTRTAMSDREQILMSISLFQNRGYGFNKISKVNYMSLTHSDKTTTPVFMNMPRVDAGKIEGLPTSIIGNIGSALYNIFKSEHSRIINHKDIAFNNDKYQKGKGLFYFLPNFNYDNMKSLVGSGQLTEREFQTIWMGGKRNLTPIINEDRELIVINKVIALSINAMIDETIASWFSNGIVSATDYMFDQKYVSKLLANNGYYLKERPDTSTFYTDNNGQIVEDQEMVKRIILAAARDYTINHFIFNTTLSQLFYGDPAETYKGKSGTTDKAQVDATMKEYAKRLAKDIAPGQDPYWQENQKEYNSITLKDVKPSDAYLKNVSTVLGDAYSEVEGTDAQELTTVQEHLDMKFAMEEISEELYNQMSQIIANAGPGGYYEFTIPEHKAVIMQPAKPVYSGQRRPDRGAAFEDYIKSSSYPLYPPVTSGTNMDGLRKLMESNNIARANFESAKKVGLPITPLDIFSKDGIFQTPSEEAIVASTQRLSRDGFRIQQEVPYDEEKEAIKIVTQMNKLITEGLSVVSTSFSIGERSYNPEELRNYKEAIRSAMIKKQLNTFYDKFSVPRDADSKDDYFIRDKNRVYNMLSEEARKKGYTLNELQSLLIRDKEGNPMLPLMFNTAADRIESLMMSMVKGIVDIKMPGKSFVQASSVGFTFTSESSIDQSKIVWAEDYDGSSLKTLRHENGAVKAAQVLLPFNFFDEKGVPLSIENFTKNVNGKRVIDTSKLPKELLQHVGARIPNQGHNSMIPVEVVGFLPKEMGDLVIVPSALTKQMGADFDVDKLYTYKRNYVVNEDGTLRTLVQDEDINVLNEQQLQDAYFNVHWSILMHPQMTEKILRPLDKPDLENENRKLAVVTNSNYYSPTSQLRDFQSGKEAKMLVGLTSLSVTFNSVIQNKDLYIYDVKFSNSGQMFEEPVYIKVRDEVTGDIISLNTLSGQGGSYYTEKDGVVPEDGDIRTKHDNLTTMQSAAVDNAKNRTLDNLNLTTNTYKAAAALIQLQGANNKAVSLKYVSRLLTQPIIKQFDQVMKTGNDSLSESFTPGLKATVIARLKNSLLPITEEGNTKIIEAIDNQEEDYLFSPQKLLKIATLEPGTKDYNRMQYAALVLFEKLDKVGQRLSELQSLFNQDTNGAGPSILNSVDKQNKLDKVEQVPIRGASRIYSSKESLTEQGVTFDSTVVVANSVITQLLPYNKLLTVSYDVGAGDLYVPIFDVIAKMGNKNNLSIDQQRNIIRSYRSFVYSSSNAWWTDSQQERVRLLFGRPNENEVSLAQRLLEAKRTWGKDNYFLQRLDARIGATTDSPDYVDYQAASVGRIDEENNNRGWLSMLLSESEEQRLLGEDLIRYAYLTGGIQDATSFVKFVPIAYLINTPFGEMLRSEYSKLLAAENVSVIPPAFIGQLFQHNPELAMQASSEQMKNLISYTSGSTADYEYPEVFRLPEYSTPTGVELDTDKYYIPQQDVAVPVEYISYRSKIEGKWILYSRRYGAGASPYYVRVDTLGNSNSDEYDSQVNGGHRSIFSENRGLAIQVNNDDGILNQFINKSYQNFYRGASEYEKINVKEGKETEISSALKAIKSNTAIPQYMRTYANFMDASEAHELGNMFSQFVFGVNKYEPRIVFNRNLDVAGTAHMDGTIELNPSMPLDATQAAEVFLHEVTHQRLQTIIMAAGYDSRVQPALDNPNISPQYRDSVIKGMDKFQKTNPELVKSVEALERVRYDALNELRNILGEERATRVLAEALAGNVPTNEHAIAYALSSVQELTAAVMTSGIVAEFLNTIDSKRGKSFLTEIWDSLVAVIEAMVNSFGFKVRDNSLLKEAITHTLKLSSENPSMDFYRATTEETIMNTSIEDDANSAVDIMQNVYGRQAIKKEYATLFSVHVTNKAINPSLNTQVAKISAKLSTQLKEAARAISRADTDEAKVAARIRYRELEENLSKLEQTQNIDFIETVGRSQLKWIDSVLANPNAKAVDVQAALNAANIWSGLIELLYNQRSTINAKEEFAQIQAEAQVRRRDLINRTANRVVIEALDGIIEFSDEDFNTNIEDLSKAEADWLTLSRAKSKLAQAIAVPARRAANNRDEEIRDNVIKLVDIEKRLKKSGFSANALIQDENWGLVQRLSNSWYKFIASIEGTRRGELERLSKLNVSQESANISRRDAWKKYWTAFNKKAVFVDVREFFDLVDGKRKDNQVALDKLATAVGSVEYAKELVNQSEELINQYIEERDMAHDYYESAVVLSPAESEGMTVEQQEDALNKKIESSYQRWLHFNSPKDFLDSVDSSKTPGQLSGDRWLVSAPKATFKEYYDPKYITITENENLHKIYEDFKELIQEMVSYLPATERAKLSQDFLPIVSTETMNTLATAVGKIKNFDTTLMNAFAATEDEELGRVQADEIPIRYTRATKRTEEVGHSEDIIRVAEIFTMMALHYKHMAPVLDNINVAESIITEVNRQRVSGEVTGETLRNLQDSIKYFKDTLIYKKPRSLEGRVDNPIYSLNPATQLKMQNEVKRLYQRKIELEKSILEENDKGNIQTEELEQELEDVNTKLDEISKNAHNIYGSKAVDTLISVNQMKALGYNPFSALSNFTFGMVSVFIHGAANVDYGSKETRRAMALMMNSTQKYFTFGTAENNTAHKITSLFDRSGLLGDIVDTSYGRTNLSTRKNNKLMSALAPFNWQRSGDYFSKGTMMIAMMLKKKVEVTENGEKKTISLWDALDDNGQWNEDKYGPNPEWSSEDVNEQKEWSKFRDKVRKMGIMVFGNQDKNAPLLARKSYLKRLVGQFRMSWLPEGIATRWADERFDAELGRNVKGRWRSITDLGVVTSAGIIAKQLVAQIPTTKINPFEGVVDKKGNPITDIDIENMRKNFAGLAWTIAFGATILMIRGFYDDDKRRGKKKSINAMRRQLLLNMMIRNYQDLRLYSSPSVIDTVSGNLLPATAVVNDAWKAIIATSKYVAVSDKDARATEAWLDKVARAFPVANLYPKTKYMLKRDLDAISK